MSLVFRDLLLGWQDRPYRQLTPTVDLAHSWSVRNASMILVLRKRVG